MKKDPQSKANFTATFKKYFDNKKDIFLLPNILCYLRVIFIITFLCLYLIPITIVGNDKAGIYLATAFMACAVYTDFLDGFIARKFNMTSNLGAALDPVADKLTQFAIALAIAIKFYEYPAILVLLALIVVKETWMFIVTFKLAEHNRTFGGAKWYGKVSSFLVYVILGVALICGPFVVIAYPIETHPVISHVIMDGLASLAVFLEAFAFINYIILYKRLMKGEGKDEVVIENKEEEKKGENIND